MIMSVQPGQNTMEEAGSSSSLDQSSAELELMRLVINCIRQSVLVSGKPGPALAASVCRVIARQARQRYQAVYKLWSDLRAASLRKLRAHLARGDISPTHQRLSTLEWAVVDLLLLYDSSLYVANFFHPAQLAALDRTFSLVQALHLEPEYGREVSPDQWRQAADRYSNNGVTLSAVALQRRWHEMKQHARQRTCVPATPVVHHAILHRYPHVAKTELPSWRGLVTAGMVAEPTAVPSPRTEPAIQCKLIRGKTEALQRLFSVAARKNAGTDDRLGKKDGVHDKSKDEPITAPDRVLVSSNNKNKEKPHCYNTDNIQPSNKICRKEIDNTDIKVKPEIIEIDDDDTPSPKADVVEAMQDIDLNNVDAMIVYESDEDVTTIFDVQMGNADKHADIDRNEENRENVRNHNKITEQSKYKIHTSCIIERDIDCGNDMPFKQNGDDSLKTAEANDNNNKHIDESGENSLNIVISKVWSERDVQKDNLNNNAETFRNGNSDSDCDSDAISVGNDVDYYSYYQQVLAKYLIISDSLDLKLVKRPVVSLQRLDLKFTNKSPPGQKPQKTIRPSSKLLYGKNKELLKQCKACEVSLTRVDRKERKTRKVKLPDIEKVRKDNRGILTAEVAPLVAEPSNVIRQYGPARTRRLLDTTDNDQSVLPKKPVLGSSESSILKNTEETHALSSTCCQNSLIDQQLQQNVLINHFKSNLRLRDRNLFQECQNNLQKAGQVQNFNVAFDSISNLMLEMSDNGLHASNVQNLHTGPESQYVSTNNMSTKDTENTQNWSENMSDTCRVSTVTPIPKPLTMLTPISAPVPKYSVSIPPPPIKVWVTLPVPTPKLPVLIPNPPIRIPKPGSTPIPTVPLPIPPVKLPKPVPTPKLPVLITNPPIRLPKPGFMPRPTVPLPIPPVKLPQLELTPKHSVPIPNLPTLTPKLEPTPEDQPVTLTPKPEPAAEPFAPKPDPPSILQPKLEPALDPSAPIPTSPTMLTPKSEPSSEPSASASNSTDVDQICTIYSDNYSPISPVDVNEFNPLKFTPILQTATLLNPTLNSALDPSRHSESSITQASLTQSAPIPDTPITSSEVTLNPSPKSYVKKSTKKPCKTKQIKPYILEFALKRSGDQVILKPLSAKKAPTKNTKTPTSPFAPSLAAFTSSVERLKRKGETVRERGQWRMEHDSLDQSEFDMDMTFAEAYYHLYREDTSFERSVPLLNLL
ncbi:uncharacterized protein LOC134802898 [Cydia splendana]|uniref:uncharacterized protein LOC134802898 n=1 Tax=Cydia splendana TaxID=1100963 RepID=UPI00300C732B